MKRVCTACHAVSDIEGDACPRCGGSTVTLDVWRNLRTHLPPSGTPAIPGASGAPGAPGIATTRPPASKPPARAEGERGDGTAFVLGIFLSFLCFAIAFITVYVVVDWIR